MAELFILLPEELRKYITENMRNTRGRLSERGIGKISKYKRKDKEVERSPVSQLRLWSAIPGVPRVAKGGPTGLEPKRVGQRPSVSDLQGT